MGVTTVQALPHTVELAAMLRDCVQQAWREERSVLVSLTEPTWTHDAVQLFRRSALHTDTSFFFRQAGGGLILAGFGSAVAMQRVGTERFRQAANVRHNVLATVRAEGLRRLPGAGPLFFGGFSFDPRHERTPLWADFGDAGMVMPRLLYTQHNEQGFVTFNVRVDARTDPDAAALELTMLWNHLTTGAGHTVGDPAALTHVTELRSASSWQTQVAHATEQIQAGKFEKLVLARGVRIIGDHPLDVAYALDTLSADYADCHVFAINRGSSCFLGATPERLVKVQDGSLTTMSLAGSSKRGSTPAEDHALGQQLFHSAKDRREHAVVVQYIADVLADLTTNLRYPATPDLLTLRNVQHLFTPITATLIPGTTLLDVVERMHPTPAVGGRPRDEALAYIRDYEALDRGWYAAPIGWIDGSGNGEFVVGLRSALVQGEQATLFAGCGIVADSDPEREYAESQLKLRPMLNALTAR